MAHSRRLDVLGLILSGAIGISLSKLGFELRLGTCNGERRELADCLDSDPNGDGVTRTDSLHCIEHRRTMRAIGSPTQKMCITTPMAIICKENGYFMAPDSGTTMRFMKK